VVVTSTPPIEIARPTSWSARTRCDSTTKLMIMISSGIEPWMMLTLIADVWLSATYISRLNRHMPIPPSATMIGM